MSIIPDRLYVDASDRESYDALEKDWIFRDRSKKEQFLLAVAIGARHGVSKALEKRAEFFHASNLRPVDEALLDTVAVMSTDSVDILSDKKEVYKIAEEFARGGIQILKDEMGGAQGSSDKRFELSLRELYDKAVAGTTSPNGLDRPQCEGIT